MLRPLVSTANRFLEELNRCLWRNRLPALATLPAPTPPAKPSYKRLERVLLTDEVNRTILEEFAAHREGERGDEETGWVLLGLREETQATVLATLPAGTQRDAGVAHVLFNSTAQALASCIVRQWDRRLTILGVLHTHPGSLRHPSDGDYRGDSQWVGRLRGREGIFGIGTADGKPCHNGTAVAHQPKKHMQCLGELCLSWYSLRQGDRNYKPVEVGLTLGPDLAQKLRPLWDTVEYHAEQLERLYQQQADVKFDVAHDPEPVLVAKIKLASTQPGGRDTLKLLLNDEGVRYYLIRDGDLIEVDPKEPRVDRGVYLILAELASCGSC
jgi:hypothetical protein